MDVVNKTPLLICFCLNYLNVVIAMALAFLALQHIAAYLFMLSTKIAAIKTYALPFKKQILGGMGVWHHQIQY